MASRPPSLAPSIALVVALMLGACSGGAGHDRDEAGRTAVRVVRLSALAHHAVRGIDAAFEELQSERDKVDAAVSGSAASARGEHAREIPIYWEQVRKSVDLLMERRALVQDATARMARIEQGAKAFSTRIDEMAAFGTRTDPRQVHRVLRMNVSAARMLWAIGRIREGGTNAAEAVDLLGREAQIIDQSLTGLDRGSTAPEIRPMTEPADRAFLADANRIWSELSPDVASLQGSTLELFDAQEAADSVELDGSAMADALL